MAQNNELILYKKQFHWPSFILVDKERQHWTRSSNSRIRLADQQSPTRRNASNPFDDNQRFCEMGLDNLEDMVDLFWDQPFAFATFMHDRYCGQLTDSFAGRVYSSEHQPSKETVPALAKTANLTNPVRAGRHPNFINKS
jgi:hypothetical protein